MPTVRHTTSGRLVLVALALVLLPAGLLAFPRAGAAQALEPVKIRVVITDNGFNDQGLKFALNVEEGQLIELTFAWDQKIHLTDEHIFILEGYNLEWQPINFEHREATVRFLADKPGAFRLKCDVECEIHDQLKNGVLNVTRRGGAAVGAGGATGATAAVDTRPKSSLTIAAPVSVTVGENARLSATAVDPSGAPIPGVKVHLFEATEFLGSLPQDVEVAQATTDANGIATLAYTARRSGARALKVLFDGDVRHQPGALELQMGVNEGAATYSVTPPPGIPGVNRFFVSAIIIAVWGTMFIVALHVLAIVRAGNEADAEQGEQRA